MNVFLLIRTENRTRRNAPVMSRNVHGVYEDSTLAQLAIPGWADEVRTNLSENEVYAAGANDIEWIIERWEVQTFE